MNCGHCTESGTIVLIFSDYEIEKGISYLEAVIQESKLTVQADDFLVDDRDNFRHLLSFPLEHRELAIETLSLMMQAYEIEGNLDNAFQTLHTIRIFDPNFKLDPAY